MDEGLSRGRARWSMQPSYHGRVQTCSGAAVGWNGPQSVLLDRQTTADRRHSVQTGLILYAIVELQEACDVGPWPIIRFS